MKSRVLHLFVSVLCALAFVLSPAVVLAEGTEDAISDDPALPAVIITEVQTGARPDGSGSDEFVELYNTTDEPIDLSGWELRYYTSNDPEEFLGTANANKVFEIVSIEINEAVIAPHDYLLLVKGDVDTDESDYVEFSGGIPSYDRSIVLFGFDDATCGLTAVDALAWGAGVFGEGDAALDTSASKDIVLQRYSQDDEYIDTNNNATDFLSTVIASGENPATPGADNEVVLSEDATLPDSASEANDEALVIAKDDCVVPDSETDDLTNEPTVPSDEDSPPFVMAPAEEESVDDGPTVPASNIGLKAPQLSEILPNPGKTKTDANDEFIELYNPNDAVFDLTDYVLSSGKKQFTFPEGTKLQPKSFKAFFSADTNLALTNSGGQVTFLDPLGKTLAQSEPYASAKDDQSWIFAGGKWQWTVDPTPNAINVVHPPETKKKKSSAASKKTAVKSSSTSAKKSATSGNDSKQQFAQASSVAPGNPLHPELLAIIGGFALLYGAYEYRHDVANKIRVFQANRAARREARQSTKGR